VDLTALPDGTLLLALNPNATARSPLALAASRDGGATWRRVAVLEDDPLGNFHYPTAIFLPGRGGARVRAPPPPQASSCAAAAGWGILRIAGCVCRCKVAAVLASICTLGVCWYFALHVIQSSYNRIK
jgi:hypothetical protein